MRFILFSCIALAVLCVSIPDQGWAQGDAKAQARMHYKKAKTAFEAGKYKKALAEYQSAYRLMKLPGFLFNIGQCYRNMKKPEEAIIAFKRYLKEKPNAPNREAVEGLVAELEAEIDLKTPLPGQKPPGDGTSDPVVDPAAPDPDEDPKKPPEPKTVPDYKPPVPGPKTAIVIPPPVNPRKPPKPRSTPIYKKWWFWTIVGAAVAGGAVGTYYGVRSSGPDLPASDLGVLDFSR